METAELREMLKALPQPQLDETWRDYASLGLGEDSVPALVEIAGTLPEEGSALDSEESYFACVHARRALMTVYGADGFLRFAEAVSTPEAVELFEMDDWFHDDIRAIVASTPELLTAALLVLRRRTIGAYACHSILDGMQELVEQKPETRERVAETLHDFLGNWEKLEPDDVSFALVALLKTALPGDIELIREICRAGAYDPFIVNWSDVLRVYPGAGEDPTPAGYLKESRLATFGVLEQIRSNLQRLNASTQAKGATTERSFVPPRGSTPDPASWKWRELRESRRAAKKPKKQARKRRRR